MFFVKLALSNLIIISCVLIGKRFPSLGGLIATMPLTSLIVLLWLASDSSGDKRLLTGYTEGVLWGIGPTVLFFMATFFCLRRGMELPSALALGGIFWIGGALLHQWLLR